MNNNTINFWMQSLSIALNASISLTSSAEELIKILEDNSFDNVLQKTKIEEFKNKFMEACEDKLSYYIRSPLDTYFLVVCLDKKTCKNLVIGPCIRQPMIEDDILQVISDLNLDKSYLDELNNYYKTLPIIEWSKLSALSNLFLENYFDVKGPFPIIILKKKGFIADINESNLSLNDEISFKTIENRAKLENKLINHVKKGDFPKAYDTFEKISSNKVSYEKLDNNLFSYKNFVILNLILRKAAESGGVHPAYIDKVYSRYTLLTSYPTNLNDNLATKMIKDYCNLVKNHSLKGINPLLKKIIAYINHNLDSELTVSGISDYFCITPNYLYLLFKNEMGISAIDFINKTRIEEACILMKDTDMQIQNIASQIGIHDTSYFSKLFKKYTGVSPSVYKKKYITLQ